MNIESVTDFKSLTPPFNIEMDGGKIEIVTNNFGDRKKLIRFSRDKQIYLEKIFSYWWGLKEEQNLYVTVIHECPAPMIFDESDRNVTKKLVVKPYEGELDYFLNL